MTNSTRTAAETDAIRAALATLTARCGFRVSSVDARLAGIPERFLFDACLLGFARLERSHFCGTSADGGHVSVYLVFA